MDITFSFLPVLLFLAFLFLLDNFRLVKMSLLVVCLGWGILSALAAIVVNPQVANLFHLDFSSLARYVSPFIEELFKALVIIWMVRTRKIGFVVDAAIYGFAAGAGFALVENIWYILHYMSDGNHLTWLIRGLGTALMHGGSTAMMAMILITAIGSSGRLAVSFLPGYLAASVLHSAYNHFPFSPLIQTLAILLLLPVLFILLFRLSSRRMQQWMEMEFSSETQLLSMIRKGRLGSTKPGLYLLTLQDRFRPEMVVDLYCFISLYLELSIKAKRNLMLKENGFDMVAEPDLEDKVAEFRQLRKNIGKTGELALAPLIRMSYRNLWKLNQISGNV
jgi:RsiW-degrading membrane proteinase PrsW (M82 family)